MKCCRSLRCDNRRGQRGKVYVLLTIALPMKLLNIDPIYRNYLICKCALKLDTHGNEIFTGLTASESLEYVVIIEAVNGKDKLEAVSDPERFLELYKRHTAALTPNVRISDIKQPLRW